MGGHLSAAELRVPLLRINLQGLTRSPSQASREISDFACFVVCKAPGSVCGRSLCPRAAIPADSSCLRNLAKLHLQPRRHLHLCFTHMGYIILYYIILYYIIVLYYILYIIYSRLWQPSLHARLSRSWARALQECEVPLSGGARSSSGMKAGYASVTDSYGLRFIICVGA